MSAESSHAGRVVRMRNCFAPGRFHRYRHRQSGDFKLDTEYYPADKFLPSPVTMKFNTALCFVLADVLSGGADLDLPLCSAQWSSRLVY